MTIQAALTLVILAATLLVLASQRLRPDLTALLVMLSLIFTGVLTPGEAFSAFGQPVIVVIGSIYVLGAALYDTGVATLIANWLTSASDRGLTVLVMVVMLTAGLLSGVLSSMLVVAALMPAVLRIARQARFAPSQLLLPMVAGATMGNLLTLIGTISNLVVSDLLMASGYEPLGFFSLTPYGLVSLLLAMLWYLLVGRRLLRREVPAEPRHPTLDEVERAYRLDRQLYRLRVRSISSLVAQRLDETGLSTDFRLNALAVQPRDGTLQPIQPDWILDQNDVLIVEGERGDALQAASLLHLEPKGTLSLEEFNRLEQETLRLAELMVPFRSRLVGRTLADIHFRERYGLNILAAHRQGQAIREDLPHLTLSAGDTLLVQGPLAFLHQVGRDLDLVVVTQLGPRPGDLITSKAKVTLGALVVMVACVVSGFLSLATAGLATAVFLVLSRSVRLGRAYRSIDGSVIVLIGGMLPLAMALEKTGAAELIARQLASFSASVGPLGGLLLLYLLTHVITQVVSNSVAAALITPIAINLATTQGLSPQPFAIAIAVAVATSYLTPLTNTDNLLVRDAGRYTMRDYVINGLPLFLLQTTVVMLMLLVLWL